MQMINIYALGIKDVTKMGESAEETYLSEVYSIDKSVLNDLTSLGEINIQTQIDEFSPQVILDIEIKNLEIF